MQSVYVSGGATPITQENIDMTLGEYLKISAH